MPTPFSFEVYTPRDDAAESALYLELAGVAKLEPSFLSVTYRVDGTLRNRSLRILRYLSALRGGRIMAHVAHLGMSREDIRALVHDMMNIGVDSFLALRGDLADSELDRVGEFASATELVAFIHQLWTEYWSQKRIRPEGDLPRADVMKLDSLKVAVTAFPRGRGRLGGRGDEKEMETLLAKESVGASFAVAQRVFHAEDYLNFVVRARDAGVTMPIIPGVMPVLSLTSLVRVSEHFELTPPKSFRSALESASNDTEQELAGIAQLTTLCTDLIDGGVTGLHFYTHNHFSAVHTVLENVGIVSKGLASA